MNETPLSRASYWALAANASAAFLMSNYLLANAWVSLSVVVSVLTFAAYAQGHRFATTGKSLPRKPYLIALALYTGLIALPPMARFKAAIFAYSLARLLMFRAIWLTERREAYLHLLLYFAVVATCFGHWRADWSLMPLLGLYVVTLVIVLTTLHQDSVPAPERPLFPWSGILTALPLVALMTLVLLLITPLLPGPQLKLFPDMPRFSQNGSPVAVGNGLSDLLERMQQQPTRANPEGPLLAPVMRVLKTLKQLVQQITPVVVRLMDALRHWWWLLVLALLLYRLWRKRRRIILWLRVIYLDPWQMQRLAKQQPPDPDAPRRLHAAFERLWTYYGPPRRPDQAPLEHLQAIRAEYVVLGKASAELVDFYQAWRYGQQPADGLAEAMRRYEQVRRVLSVMNRKKTGGKDQGGVAGVSDAAVPL